MTLDILKKIFNCAITLCNNFSMDYLNYTYVRILSESYLSCDRMVLSYISSDHDVANNIIGSNWLSGIIASSSLLVNIVFSTANTMKPLLTDSFLKKNMYKKATHFSKVFYVNLNLTMVNRTCVDRSPTNKQTYN